jgi:uncharacterized protein (TIGR03437 family)
MSFPPVGASSIKRRAVSEEPGGTGFRNRSSLANVTATIGGTNAQVTYAGPQGTFVGLDQANIRIPASLAGRGEVNVVLTVDGKSTNPVVINVK